MAVVPTRLTADQVRINVLARLGLGDAAAASPEILAQALGAIGSIQRALCLAEDWLLPRKRLIVSVTEGRRWLPLPCLPEGLAVITWQLGNQDPRVLTPELGATDIEAVDQPYGDVERYGIRVTTGVTSVTVGAGGSGHVNGASATFADPGGTGYAARGTLAVTAGAITAVNVTDQGADYAAAPAITVSPGSGATMTAVIGDVYAVLLDPIPALPGIAVLEYRDKPSATLLSTDRLVVDEELITLMTMYELAPSVGKSDQMAAMEERARAYFGNLRQARPSGGRMTLSMVQAARGRR